ARHHLPQAVLAPWPRQPLERVDAAAGKAGDEVEVTHPGGLAEVLPQDAGDRLTGIVCFAGTLGARGQGTLLHAALALRQVEVRYVLDQPGHPDEAVEERRREVADCGTVTDGAIEHGAAPLAPVAVQVEG